MLSHMLQKVRQSVCADRDAVSDRDAAIVTGCADLLARPSRGITPCAPVEQSRPEPVCPTLARRATLLQACYLRVQRWQLRTSLW